MRILGQLFSDKATQDIGIQTPDMRMIAGKHWAFL
jgi:hypothetical protein